MTANKTLHSGPLKHLCVFTTAVTLVFKNISYLLQLNFPGVHIVSYSLDFSSLPFMLLTITLDLNVVCVIHAVKVKPVWRKTNII